jgi:hypothetical protein
MAAYTRIGRLHINEEELSKLLGFEGGRVIFIGWMPSHRDIGITIEHENMPLVPLGGEIPEVKRPQ